MLNSSRKRFVRSIALVLPLAIIVLWSSILSARASALAHGVAAPALFPDRNPAVYAQSDYLSLTQARHAVGADFTSYYQNHQGSLWLGDAITPEISTGKTQEQVFQGGILQATTAGEIKPLPIVTSLIDAGAVVSIGASSSSITYSTLRDATSTNELAVAPWWWQQDEDPATAGIFVQISTKNGATVGYYVPAVFATTLTQLGDWRSVIGAPIMQTQYGIVWVRNIPHRVIIQVFERAVLVLDRDATTPAVSFQSVGADYLSIYGPPQITDVKGMTAWAAASPSSVVPAPGIASSLVTLYPGFAVTLTGETLWSGGNLWYHVSWTNPLNTRDGWLPADQLSFITPTQPGLQLAYLSALSLDLSTYATSQGNDVSVSIYVPDLNRYYVYNPNLGIVMASTFKVPILLALLTQAEAQGRTLSQDEIDLATAMIENSDNDAASALYQDVGYNIGIDQLSASLGLTDLQVNGDSFGYSTISSLDMTRMLNALWSGKILTADDRQFALNLLGSVETDQQFGIGETAPAGAQYAMKDGWLADDNGWVTDSVGIVTANGHTYVISVYVRNHPNIDDGWAVVNTICADIAQAITGAHS